MTTPPPRRRGAADLTSAADLPGRGGRRQNVYWRLFKLEMNRLRQEHEQAIAEQRARVAGERIAVAEAKMAALFSDARVAGLIPRPPAPAAMGTHRYGAKPRRSP